MPITALRLECGQAIAMVLAEHLENFVWPAPLSVALHEVTDGGNWAIEAHFDPAPDETTIADVLRQALGGTALPVFSLSSIKPRDWVAASLENLKPVRAGRIFVHGAHDRNKIPAAAIAVQIDAGQAFGTGHHQTTTACLLALGDIAAVLRPRRILDVGTGSGVLAIAAAKLLKTEVVATDNDPIAIAVAKANARANGVAPLFAGRVAHGVRHRDVARARGYDLIFANILARPLARLAGEISACLDRRGNLVLSGILNSQNQSVLAAYQARGLVLRRRIRLGDWTTLVIGG
ncbi:Ribosomal protein L11 methyltransferase [hydrothermal vent metagenome]|uniref:Ribosomal protein L11 methyltransferase n=1 Tax=hydrothermal vent metagenome TaxID=652676 RepID=A0A3B0THF9_9ZZZZ